MILRVLYLLPALLFGLTLSQAPEFAQQYRQRLGGALDELAAMVARFDADASRENLTRDAAIARLDGSSDPLVRGRADDLRLVVARRDRLARQQVAFADAGAFSRLFVLARDFDADLAARAWQAYEPAVPATLEGVATAGAGLVAGMVLSETARLALARRRRRRGRTG